ncbi:MAG: DUF448 domain-containing protein [Sphingomonadaceae bacterium]|nr:DUF448 domain-containing protein [Sphingomonadaceae bacterium]
MRSSPDEPQRRCILSGGHRSRSGLIRLALGPDGTIAPDLQARAGGRGAWIGVTAAELDIAIAKGRLKGALARAFKTQPPTIPGDLTQRIADGLERLALDRIGLENRGGALIYGTERIADAAAAGTARLVVSVADAGRDARALAAKARGAGIEHITLPAARATLSAALGRANVVHLGVLGENPARRIAEAVTRWREFIGTVSSDAEGDLDAAPASAEAGEAQESL